MTVKKSLVSQTIVVGVPASDTGAFKMAMWTMLGQRGVDILSWGFWWLAD